MSVYRLTLLLPWLVTGCHQPVRSLDPFARPLEVLRAGNLRFANQHTPPPRSRQHGNGKIAPANPGPFAVIVSCSDQSESVSRVFDQGTHQLFVIRLAGNAILPGEVGSIDYAVDYLNTPLVVVMGHTGCGTIASVVNDNASRGGTVPLLTHIELAVERVRDRTPNLAGAELIMAATEENVWIAIEDLILRSSTVRRMLRSGAVKVVGAMYDVHTGQVEWLGPHPRQFRLLRRGQQDAFEV